MYLVAKIFFSTNYLRTWSVELIKASFSAKMPFAKITHVRVLSDPERSYSVGDARAYVKLTN